MHILTKKNGDLRKKRYVGFFMAGLMTLAGVGTAFAYWTIGGSGTGNGTTAAPSSVTVVQTRRGRLYPGDSVALAGDFNNPNSGKVYVTAVTALVASFSSVAVNAGLPACTQADFTISGTSNRRARSRR